MSHPPGFDARRFKALERSGFNRIAARYADGAPLRADLQDALLAFADTIEIRSLSEIDIRGVGRICGRHRRDSIACHV